MSSMRKQNIQILLIIVIIHESISWNVASSSIRRPLLPASSRTISTLTSTPPSTVTSAPRSILYMAASLDVNNSSTKTSETSARSSLIRKEQHEKEGDNDEEPSNKRRPKRIVQMKFVGTKKVSALPVPHDGELLNEFFATDQFRNLLFDDMDISKGEILSSDGMKREEEWMKIWSRETAKLGNVALDGTIISSPSSNSVKGNREQWTIMQMKANLQFPGLKVISLSTIGVKLILPSTCAHENEGADVALPEYQFTLLDSQLQPSGPAPLVWIFHKLTKYRDATSSFTRVRAERVPRTADEVMFTTEARLETRIRLPTAALRVMSPSVNIARFERQGSDSVQTLLEKELEPALVKFRNAYCKFLEEKSWQ